MRWTKQIISSVVIAVMLLLIGCEEETFTPKPKGYHRIEFPAKAYQKFAPTTCPYAFEYPVYAEIVYDSIFFNQTATNPCWLDINIPKLAGEINLSYKSIDAENTLEKLVDDAYKLAYKHTIKADYIDESIIYKPSSHISGVLYEIGGNSASNIQFYLTDSTNHFLRGSLYFGTAPNQDSLAPVIKFVREDLLHLIETLEWKE